MNYPSCRHFAMEEDDAHIVRDFVSIDKLQATAYTIPTDLPEADGTLQWNSTTLVLVEVEAGGMSGIGYTYAAEATASFIQKEFAPLVNAKNAFDIEGINYYLQQQVRNSGNCGIAMMAVSAIDNALWDLKAKLLNLPLCRLLGTVREHMLVYGSGGFTSYNQQELQTQLSGWQDQGIRYMKMKIGTHPEKDVDRVRQAREVLNETVELMVDANGAYQQKQALEMAEQIATCGVTWFEEPVRSDNFEGLQFIKQGAPASINVAAGEYGFNLHYYHSLLKANAVDVVQADATRCGGLSNFLKIGGLCEAHQVPYSSHCAPSLHLHAALALPSFFIGEYFHDHVRIERLLFDGISMPKDGFLLPDLSRAGYGVEFKYADAAKYKC
jgi:L-alanine-DL-glutamate epimerase-like enolase superfamily enzyme